MIGIALSFGIVSAMGLLLLLAALRAGSRAEAAESQPCPVGSLEGGDAVLPALRRLA